MGKVSPKKHDVFIDMTAMSDVCVLLLTFFMLTATFKPKAPVDIQTPQSVSETKVPDFNILSILVNPKVDPVTKELKPQVYLQFDKPENGLAVLEKMGNLYGITFTPQQKISFANQVSIGMPIKDMSKFLNLPMSAQDAELKKYGIPADSTNNELANWIRFTKEVYKDDMKFGIKADKSTPYPLVGTVMKTLVDQKANRYSLMTSLKSQKDIEAIY